MNLIWWLYWLILLQECQVGKTINRIHQCVRMPKGLCNILLQVAGKRPDSVALPFRPVVSGFRVAIAHVTKSKRRVVEKDLGSCRCLDRFWVFVSGFWGQGWSFAFFQISEMLQNPRHRKKKKKKKKKTLGSDDAALPYLWVLLCGHPSGCYVVVCCCSYFFLYFNNMWYSKYSQNILTPNKRSYLSQFFGSILTL